MTASLPRRRRLSFAIAGSMFVGARPFRRVPSLVDGLAQNPRGPGKAFGSKPFMHLSFYLMIAALVVTGLQVLYALRQLAIVVL